MSDNDTGPRGAKLSRRALAGLGLLAATGCASAQTATGSDDSAREQLNLWPGAPPGTEGWSAAETTAHYPLPGVTTEPVEIVMNVSVPTLTIYRPRPQRATGAAMIVCPGGGFFGLAYDHEGKMVAQRLAEWGMTAFLLKYRVNSSRPPIMPANGAATPAQTQPAPSLEPGRRVAVADGLQALRVVRENAARYGIDANKVGVMGFSAGGMLTMGTIQDSQPGEGPNFAAPIYGAMQDKPLAPNAPPIFIATAADDTTVPAQRSIAIFSAWSAAQRPAELHIYENGGHGFGLLRTQRASDQWSDDFAVWLARHGWARPR